MMAPDPHVIVEGITKDGSPERHELREADIKLLFYELSHLAQLAQLGGIFCDFARGGASRIKGLDDARG